LTWVFCYLFFNFMHTKNHALFMQSRR
jgi:hypothetical protein